MVEGLKPTKSRRCGPRHFLVRKNVFRAWVLSQARNLSIRFGYTLQVHPGQVCTRAIHSKFPAVRKPKTSLCKSQKQLLDLQRSSLSEGAGYKRGGSKARRMLI